MGYFYLHTSFSKAKNYSARRTVEWALFYYTSCCEVSFSDELEEQLKVWGKQNLDRLGGRDGLQGDQDEEGGTAEYQAGWNISGFSSSHLVFEVPDTKMCV